MGFTVVNSRRIKNFAVGISRIYLILKVIGYFLPPGRKNCGCRCVAVSTGLNREGESVTMNELGVAGKEGLIIKID